MKDHEIKEDENLTEPQRRGIKGLVRRVKDNELVVFQTDKSGRFSVDTPDNYRESVMPHVGDDPQVSQNDHDAIDKTLTAHGISWVRMLSAGENSRHEDRIKDNMISSNSPIPPLYGLRKDHKFHHDVVAGPPSRPVCGADSSANFRLSHLLSLILSELWQRDQSGSVCMNTEEMMAEVTRVNSEDIGEDTIIGSTDVKALYPSLDIDFTINTVCEFFEASGVVIHGVDYEEMGLYISLNRTIGQIRDLGLDKVCPTRIGKQGKPTITASGTAYEKEDRFSPWSRAESVPSQQQQRVMFREALRIGLEVVMKNHVYRFDSCIRKQESGGPIGLELTGNIAQVFMIWWDRVLKLRLHNLGIVVYTLRSRMVGGV